VRRSTSARSMPPLGCLSTVPRPGCVRSTAMSLGITNCVPMLSTTVARRCMRIRLRTRGCSRESGTGRVSAPIRLECPVAAASRAVGRTDRSRSTWSTGSDGPCRGVMGHLPLADWADPAANAPAVAGMHEAQQAVRAAGLGFAACPSCGHVGDGDRPGDTFRHGPRRGGTGRYRSLRDRGDAWCVPSDRSDRAQDGS